jgi:hypothetical protein
MLACKKDHNPSYDNGFIKKIEDSRSSYSHDYDFTFVYDNQGRIYSINDTIYNYSSNGKITRSTYNNKSDRSGYIYEKDIQKSYRWDTQGRILEIKVDKWFQKLTSPDGGEMKSDPIPYIEAHFYYTGNNSLPDSIGYGDFFDQSIKTFLVVQHENGNVTETEALSSTYLVDRYVHEQNIYTYDKDVKNHLYPLYNQMGFLPKGLGYIASKSNPTSVTTENFTVEHAPFPSDQYSINKVYEFSTSFIYSSASNGFPSSILHGTGYGTPSTIQHIYY